jgi:hypothetical protein
MHCREQLIAFALRLRNPVQPGLDLERLTRREEWIEDDLLRDDATVPADFVTRPARMLMSVDFPAPFGPRRPKICPRGTSKLTSFSARLPPS